MSESQPKEEVTQSSTPAPKSWAAGCLRNLLILRILVISAFFAAVFIVEESKAGAPAETSE